jgi:hypothetical protein
MRAWVEQYKGPKGFVDRQFFVDMAREDGVLPAALVDEPKLPFEYHHIVIAHDDLKSDGLIPYAEMNAWLCDYPEIEPRRFKMLLRTLDRACYGS